MSIELVREPEPLVSREAFAETFVQLRGALVSYLFRLTANRADAEDLAQSAYLKAVDKLETYTAKSSLKTWVFAIATNLARDHYRVKRRWLEDTQDRCRTQTQASPEKVSQMREIVASSPAEAYAFQEHIDYCFTCLAKTLRIEQQLALILKEVYQFKVSEIMAILQLSEGRVKHALSGGRQVMNDIFDRRCTLVNKAGVCHQCSEMSGFVNPRQDAHQQAMALPLVHEAKQGAATERLFALRMALVRHLDPLQVPGAALHAYLLELMEETDQKPFG